MSYKHDEKVSVGVCAYQTDCKEGTKDARARCTTDNLVLGQIVVRTRGVGNAHRRVWQRGIAGCHGECVLLVAGVVLNVAVRVNSSCGDCDWSQTGSSNEGNVSSND